MHLSSAQLIFQGHLTTENHVADLMKTMRTTLLVVIVKVVNIMLTAHAKRIIALITVINRLYYCSFSDKIRL